MFLANVLFTRENVLLRKYTWMLLKRWRIQQIFATTSSLNLKHYKAFDACLFHYYLHDNPHHHYTSCRFLCHPILTACIPVSHSIRQTILLSHANIAAKTPARCGIWLDYDQHHVVLIPRNDFPTMFNMLNTVCMQRYWKLWCKNIFMLILIFPSIPRVCEKEIYW